MDITQDISLDYRRCHPISGLTAAANGRRQEPIGLSAVRGFMNQRRICVLAGLIASAWLLAAPGAGAFTFENKDGAGNSIGKFDADKFDPKKFDLDEQRRQFSKDGSSSASPALNSKGLMEVPLGTGGSLQFGVQSGSDSS